MGASSGEYISTLDKKGVSSINTCLWDCVMTGSLSGQYHIKNTIRNTPVQETNIQQGTHIFQCGNFTCFLVR